MSQLSRRTFLKLAGAAAGVSALAACAPPPAAPPAGEPAKPPEAPKAVAKGPIKLELWTFVNTHARWFRSMAADYKK